jgi:hypothetical protein
MAGLVINDGILFGRRPAINTALASTNDIRNEDFMAPIISVFRAGPTPIVNRKHHQTSGTLRPWWPWRAQFGTITATLAPQPGGRQRSRSTLRRPADHARGERSNCQQGGRCRDRKNQ